MNDKTFSLQKGFIKDKHFVVYTLVYVLAFFLIPINSGLYLDDWVHYAQDPAARLQLFKELGFFAYWPAYLYDLILNTPSGVLVSRALTFILYLFSGYMLYAILKKEKSIDRTARLFLVIFFALFPVNFARIYSGHIIWTLCYFLFFVGSWFLSKFLHEKKMIYRFLSLLCFFLSFSTNSLLFYYSLALLYILYFRHKEKGLISLLATFRYLIGFLDFLLLPLVFWFIKNAAFVPFGLYADYNNISLSKVILGPLPLTDLYSAFRFSFMDPSGINRLLSRLSFLAAAVILAAAALFWKYRAGKNEHLSLKWSQSFAWCGIFGLIAIFIGAYPYVMVGKVPSNAVLEISRYQLLIPLGAAFLLYYLIAAAISSLRMTKIVLVVVCSLFTLFFILVNLKWYLDCQIDWFKQRAITEAFRSSEIMKANTTFFFVDELMELNVSRRTYRDYEYSGLLKFAFGDTKRLGLSEGSSWLFDHRNNPSFYKKYLQYNVGQWERKESYDYRVTIRKGTVSLNRRMGIKLVFLMFLDHKKFDEYLRHIVVLRCQPRE